MVDVNSQICYRNYGRTFHKSACDYLNNKQKINVLWGKRNLKKKKVNFYKVLQTKKKQQQMKNQKLTKMILLP